ncbi:hypothetical protein PENTCL1PPCAC_8805, partial [Pristionchus entomophagus]
LVFLGETRCDEIPPELKSALDEYPWSTLVASTGKGRKGQAGVPLFSKEQPLNIWKGTGVEEFDDAGRLIIAEYATFFFAGAYAPNSGARLENLPKRRRWEATIRRKLSDLDVKKPVIYGGDLNVAHQKIDAADYGVNIRTAAGFADQERADMTALLGSGFTDTYRSLHKDSAAYTSYLWMGARIPARLDYFLASNRLVENITESDVMDDGMSASDHCPIMLKIII